MTGGAGGALCKESWGDIRHGGEGGDGVAGAVPCDWRCIPVEQ